MMEKIIGLMDFLDMMVEFAVCIVIIRQVWLA